MRRALVVASVVAAACVVLAGGACEQAAPKDELSVDGALERDAVGGSSDAAVPISFRSKGARGEWWPCDLRMTANACENGRHANVFLSLPGAQSFDDLGQTDCVDDQGNAFGAFELLTAKAQDGDSVTIPGDVSVLVLFASDVDGDGSADLDNDDETKAASRLTSGTVRIQFLGEFDDPLTLAIEGKTSAGNDVEIGFNGAMTSVGPPPLDPSRTCVDGDLVE